MACSARQLVASIDRSHKKRNTAANSVARCRAKRSASSSGGGASMSRPSRATSRPRIDARPCSLSSPAVAAVTHGKARLQDRLHLPGPETVRMIFLQFLASSEQVIQTGLVQRGSVAAIRHPPVAHEHPGEVGPENRGGIVEPAAGANGVDRRLRGDEGPQPVADGHRRATRFHPV